MATNSHIQQDLIPAVFPTRQAAVRAIKQLREAGIDDTDLGLALLEPGRYVREDRHEEAVAKSVARGAVEGLPIGSLAGLLLFGLAIPGVDELAVAGLLAGGLWGAFFGGLGGLLAKVRWNADEDRWCEIPLKSNEILLTVRAGGRGDEAHQILQTSGATCFLDPHQHAGSAR